jgi:hypothetical protein
LLDCNTLLKKDISCAQTAAAVMAKMVLDDIVNHQHDTHLQIYTKSRNYSNQARIWSPAVGSNGVKLMETPQDVNPTDFIKNFQSNRTDRFKIALTLSVICGIILTMPILFCLKADGDIDSQCF